MNNWKSIVAAIAPTLATVLGGPLAGVAIQAISQAVLGRPNGSEAEVAAAVSGASPDVLARIREADTKLQTELAQAGIQLEQIAAADRDSARKREAATKDPTTRYLAMVYTVGYFAALWAVWKFGLPPDTNGVMQVLIGGLTAAQLQILNYYFGSSSGSAHKNDILERVANGNR
jgi:fructoselysine-6-P-deglycase FrlB-like protein